VAGERLWTPGRDRAASARLMDFTRHVERASGEPFVSYDALHRWSVESAPEFWRHIWTFCGVVGDPGIRDVVDAVRMPGARFLPDARFNFAENLLRRQDNAPAIIATSEAARDLTLTFAELNRDVRRAAAALRAAGVQSGDRVCGIVANVPEAIIAALGAAAIGAVWSSCSPDFGVAGILDRFGQIAPSVLLSMDRYQYAGKNIDCLQKLRDVAAELPSVLQVVVIPYDPTRHTTENVATAPEAVWWAEWLGAQEPDATPFERFPFSHPLYILYSSGTTGVPKCIVHGAGGTLLQHLKEHQLHCDIRRDDRVFYFTTCGWMMWNWLVSALASEATLVLYDGSPFHPDARCLFDVADRARVSLFGTSAKFLDAARKAGVTPRVTHDLASVRTITSTGSPLAPESFDYVYADIKADVHLASISGGTDIVSCFVLGNPSAPVYRGEIQAAGLGMDVDVFDAEGNPVVDEAGELVCKSPFPSMPLGFWHDPDGAAYHAAYFARFPGVWCHGDWTRVTPRGGYVIYGRSDATLKPGGVRIGTAEIYRQVEQLPEILESLAIGQSWDNDERIVLFVRLAPGITLDDTLRAKIAQHIRRHASPRHVPARIVAVPDIPRTKSGKIVELAVRNIVHGRPVVNREALANPEALEHFRDRAELRS